MTINPNSSLIIQFGNFIRNYFRVYQQQDKLSILFTKYHENKNLQQKKTRKILIATNTGGHEAITPIEKLLAMALTIRSADVHILLCDKFLPACLLGTMSTFESEKDYAKSGPKKFLCNFCYETGLKNYSALKLPIHFLSDYINKKELELSENISRSIRVSDIPDFCYKKIRLGEHAYAGTLRYYARADLKGQHFGDVILRRYLKSALQTYFAIENLLEKIHYDGAVFHHGIYIPQGIIGEVARSRNIDVVNWNPAYRKKCFIFSRGDTYHHTLISESVKKWENLNLTSKMENKLVEYLKSRWKGTQDWIWFHEKPLFNIEEIEKKTGIDFSKPTIGLLTNVMWDAQLHYPANAFPNMITWLTETIKYFSKRHDLQLIIRIHPAEVRGTLPSRQFVAEEIRKKFKKLPKNILIITPESEVSTYALMYKCNAVIIYGTKTGVELTSMGIPVIVAGEAWIRNKGITYDAKNKAEYLRFLNKLPFKEKMGRKQIKRARKYAYHFFFRRMIPIACMKPESGWPPYRLNIKSMNSLKKGFDPGLDTICTGILEKKDFIYKADEYDK